MSKCKTGSCGYPKGFEPNCFIFDEGQGDVSLNGRKITGVKVKDIKKDLKTEITTITLNTKVQPYTILQTRREPKRRFVVYKVVGYRKYLIRRINSQSPILTASDMERLRKNTSLKVVGMLKTKNCK